MAEKPESGRSGAGATSRHVATIIEAAEASRRDSEELDVPEFIPPS